MSRPEGFRILLSTMLAAIQWRLLLLWLGAMLIPATIAALPLWRMLGGLLDRSVHAAAWAQHFNDIMVGDVIAQLHAHPQWVGAGLVMGLVSTVLLAPFLDGVIVGSGRVGRVLHFSALLQNGVIEYGRMFRLMLWSLLPYALFAAAAGLGGHLADKHAEQAVLESQADSYANGVHGVLWVLFVLVQSIVESARAAFIADVSLHSATRALWRGVRQLASRPVRTLLFYVVVTLIGVLLASIFAVARLHMVAVGAGGFLGALLLSQLIVLSIGWMRAARLFALAEVGRSLLPRNVM